MTGFNEDEWIAQIIKLVNDDEYRASIKENAIATILTKFTWNQISDKLFEIKKVLI